MEHDSGKNPTQAARRVFEPCGSSGGRSIDYFLLNSSSIVFTTFGSSGFTPGLKRAATWPSRPTRNFSKFQVMSPLNFEFLVRFWYSGQVPAPFTTTFD